MRSLSDVKVLCLIYLLAFRKSPPAGDTYGRLGIYETDRVVCGHEAGAGNTPH